MYPTNVCGMFLYFDTVLLLPDIVYNVAISPFICFTFTYSLFYIESSKEAAHWYTNSDSCVAS